MPRISLTLALVLSVTLMTTAGAASQDEVPFDEYVASLQAFKADMAALNDSRSSDGMPTVEETLGNLDASLPLYEAEIERLRAVMPEPCYAAAHEEVIGFQESTLAILGETRPLLEDVETVMGMLPFLMMAGEEIAARHPAAVVEDTSTLTGTASDLLYIIPALATCDGADAVAPATPAPETMADTSNDAVAQDVTSPDADELVVLDSGSSATSDGVTLGIIITNPNEETWAATDVTVRVTVVDDEGFVVTTTDTRLPLILPGQTVALGGTASDASGGSNIEVQLGEPTWRDVGNVSGGFETTDVRTRLGNFGLTTTGRIVADLPGPVEEADLVAVYYRDDEIVGGAIGRHEFLRSDEPSPFQIDSWEQLPEPERTEVYGRFASIPEWLP